MDLSRKRGQGESAARRAAERKAKPGAWRAPGWVVPILGAGSGWFFGGWVGAIFGALLGALIWKDHR